MRIIKFDCVGSPEGGYWDDCGRYRISRIYVATKNDQLAGIQFGYVDGENSIVISDRYGGIGTDYNVVMLNHPSEYLVSFSGTCTYEDGHAWISSISFCTNQQRHGPFGLETNMKFQMEIRDDFYGFYGYSNHKHLCAIGVNIRPDANLRQQDIIIGKSSIVRESDVD